MKLSEVVSPDTVIVPLEAGNVTEALALLGERLAATDAVEDPGVWSGSGESGPSYRHPGEGVLLAHTEVPSATRLAVAIGVAPEPLRAPRDAEAAAARVIIGVVSPGDDLTLYRRAVDALARGLEEGKIARRLLAARSTEDVTAIRELMELGLDEPILARHAMSDRAFRVYPDTSVSEVVDLMVRHGIAAVPVVGEKQEVLGIVTVKDVLRHLIPRRRAEEHDGSGSEGDDAGELVAKDTMTRAVMCVSEDQKLVDVANLLLNREVTRIPVVREGVLTGSLSEIDILTRLFGR